MPHALLALARRIDPILLATVALATAGVVAAASATGVTVRDDLTPEDLARVEAVTAAPTDFTKAEPFELMAGGATTSLATPDGNAFSHPSANLTFEGETDFKVGNGLFKKVWVSSPASTEASDGLGPLWNARSCQRCHLKDGRGHPPEGPGDSAISMFLRLSVPARTEAEHAALARREQLRIPEPTYGGQLQDHAVPGIPAEGRMVIDYEEIPVELAGGEIAMLRKPTYSVADLGYGPLDPETMLSPRVAPQMIGLGLLEAIHPADILARADPDDADGDGISGRPSWVRNPETGEIELGRFGWKASSPTVRVQSAEAFAGDIGISTPLMPDPFGGLLHRPRRSAARCRTGVQERLGTVEAPRTGSSSADLLLGEPRRPAPPRPSTTARCRAERTLFHELRDARPATAESFVTSRQRADPSTAFPAHLALHRHWLLHDHGAPGLATDGTVGEARHEWRTCPLWGHRPHADE